jgi:hypothetical protein
MKLTEEQVRKLNEASALLGQVRAQLVQQCAAMSAEDPDVTAWTPLFQLESKLNVFILQSRDVKRMTDVVVP